MGTHMNCMDRLKQFKWVPTTYAFMKVDKKYTGCILKTMESLDCSLIGVCAVIRSNTVTQMHVATPTFATCSLKGQTRDKFNGFVFFPAGAQHGLSLLVCNKIFLPPCWCVTGSSFPSGA